MLQWASIKSIDLQFIQPTIESALSLTSGIVTQFTIDSPAKKKAKRSGTKP
jgi:hypothetical protein